MSESFDDIALHVEIGQNDLQKLMKANMNLYIVRSVELGGEEQAGNVVFCETKSKDLAATLDFKWVESYQVFQTVLVSTEPGVDVTAGTKIAGIEGGKTATFNGDSGFVITGAPKSGDPFHVVNNWKSYASVAVSNTTSKGGAFTPIYVSAGYPMHTNSTLLPLKKFDVFWMTTLKTSTIVDISKTNPHPVDLTGGQKTIKFENDQWVDLKL